MFLKLFLVVFGLSAQVHATTYFNREKGFFDNSFDGRETPEDYAEAAPADVAFGGYYDVDFQTRTGLLANFFGTDIQYFRFFDVGYAECGSAAITTIITGAGDLPTVDVATGTALENSKCLVVPYLMDVSLASYLMSVRVVKEGEPQNKQDLDRASAEINRAKNQWREKWVAKAAIIATWKIENAASNINQFQAIVAVGETDTPGTLETYVLSVYESASLTIAGAGIKGFVNGLYTGAANTVYAKVCAESGSPVGAATDAKLGTDANWKCGNPGVFVLPVSGPTCDPADPCSLTVVNPNCNLTVVPFDTCTESFFCQDTGSQIELNITVVQPIWPRLQAIDYVKFDTNEEQELISYTVGGIEQCVGEFNPYDTESSVGYYKINIPKAPISTCGTVYDAVAKTVKFAYKLWDGTPNSMMVDRFGNMIISGECHFEDLPISVTQAIMNNDLNPHTVVPPRVRQLTLNVIDRPDADGSFVLTQAKVGRDLWLLVTLDPGTPWNRWTDPYAVKVIDGWAANNAEFEHETVADPWKKSQKFISNGCGVDKTTGALEAIWLENTSVSKSFEADTDHIPNPPTGASWYLIAGSIQANKWTKLNAAGTAPVDKIFFKVTVQFCTRDFERNGCVDNCPSDPARRRRSVDDNDEMQTLYTKLTITDEDDEDSTVDSSQTSQKTDDETCTNFTTAVSTMAVLLAMLVIAVILCILIMLKWVNVKNKAKRSSMKKVPT